MARKVTDETFVVASQAGTSSLDGGGVCARNPSPTPMIPSPPYISQCGTLQPTLTNLALADCV